MAASAADVCVALRPLIESGNASHVSCLLKQAVANGIAPEQLLDCRYETGVVVKRPSTGRDILVKDPTPLVLAVAGWYEEVVQLLAALRAALDATCRVRDDSSVVCEYDGVTAVMLAAITGRQPFLQQLLDAGASANAQNSLGDTPIYQACLEGHAAAVESLIRAGAYLDLPNHSGIAPLMISSFVGNAEVLELLLRYGARTDGRDASGKNSLFYCVPAGWRRCFQLLLQAGARPQPENKGTTLLMEAAYQGSVEMLELLLERPDTGDLAAVDASGRSAVFYAIDGGSVPAFARLLRAGASLTPLPDTGTTPLMAAVLKYRKDLVELLVDLGEGVRDEDAEGRNALFYCAANPEPDILQLLLTCGLPLRPAADSTTLLMSCISARNWKLVQYLLQRLESLCPLQQLRACRSDGSSALTLAIESQNSHLLQQLVSLGAHPQLHQPVGADRRSLLMHACACGNADAALYLADTCGGVQDTDATGRNLLFHCVAGGHLDLLRHFAEQLEPAIANDGCSVLHDACSAARAGVVQFLLQQLPPEQVSARDNRGRSSLFAAVAGGSVRVLQLLHDHLEQLLPAVDSSGVTLLMHSAAVGNKEVRQFVREHRQEYQVSDTAVDAAGRGLVFHAAESNSWETLAEVLDAHPSVSLEAEDKEGRRVVSHCLLSGGHSLAEELVARAGQLGLRLQEADAGGDSLLFHAASAGSRQLVERLLRLRLSPVADDGRSVVAVCYAAGHSRLAEHLLDVLPTTPELLNGGDNNGSTVFHHLVASGDLRRLKQFAGHFRPAQDADARGRSLLMLAAAAADNDCVQLLLDHFGFGQEAANRLDAAGRNALSYAAASASFDTCRLLLSCGVRPPPEPEDGAGASLLHEAAAGGCQRTFCHFLRFLVADRRLLVARDADGATPTHLLCRRGLCEAVEAVRQLGAPLGGLRDKEGRTQLMLAAASGHLLLLKLLLQHGDDSTADTDAGGRSCLHYACAAAAPNPLVLRQLIDRGASVSLPDDDGLRPLHLAVAAAEPKAVLLLLQRGADPFAQTPAGDNAFELSSHACASVLEKHFRVPKAQADVLESYSRQLSDADWLSLADRLASGDAILCRSNARQVRQLRQQERRRRLLALVMERGGTKLHELLAAMKPMAPSVAMEMRAKLFTRPQSEFMV